MRVDTVSLISGAVVCGDRGLGVLGSVILSDTATGDFGAGYLHNDVDIGDENKEFRGLMVTPPSAGTFFAYEDGSFSLVAPDGAYTFVYRLYVDGVDLGTATANVTIGGAATASLAITTDAAVFAGSATGTAGGTATLAITTGDAVFLGAAFAGATISMDLVTDASVFVGEASVSLAAVLALTPTGRVTFEPINTAYTFGVIP